MRKKWQKTLLSAALALALVATGITVFGGPKPGTAHAAPSWSDIQIAETYDYGAQFNVPARTVTVGDKTVVATSVLEYPDGTATRHTSAVLNVSGKYFLRYTAVVDGQPYAEEFNFTVIDPLVAFDTDKSSARYGLYDSVAAGATKAVQTPGLMVRLAEGDKLTVNKLIDVRGLTKNDVLIESFVTPSRIGRADFTNIVFTLTDATNPEVFLRFSGRQSSEGDGYPVTYFLAGGNGQVLAGYEEYWDRIHINNEWGTYTEHSFTGKFDSQFTEVALDSIPMSIRYDEEEDAAYAGERMIIDFDDPKYFATLWKGFATGYARLTIEADAYNSATADFCLTKILGVDLQAQTVETETPVITVDCEYTDMPEAKVGGTYPVPAATAFDNYSGHSPVKTSVYYNYASPNTINIAVNDGQFMTDKVGTYAIVYETTNKKGLSAREILWVHAGDTIEDISLTSEQIDTTENVTLGAWVALSPITAVGGSGRIDIQTVAELNGEVTEIKDGFRPDKTGDYTVRITATDYIGNSQTAEFTVHAEPGDKPVFVDVPTLPTYFIGGGTYTVPELYVNDYASGTCVRKLATAEIGGQTYNAGETFVPTVENNGDEVVVTFTCENATLPVPVKTIKAFVREGTPLRDRLHMENYLVGEGVERVKNSDSITVTATESDGSWTFANELVAENFDLELIGKSDATFFGAVNVYFTDAVHKDVSVLVKLLNTGDKANIVVNNTKINVSYGFTNGGTFNLGYASKAVTVGASEIAITNCVNGDAFDGFPSGRIMLTIEFEDAIAGRAAYYLSKVNGQPMNNATSDRISPKISVLDRSYGGCVSIGATKRLPAAMAGDTLDPFVAFSLTVTAPDGSIAKDVDGKPLENVDPTVVYEVKCDAYGQYRVSYTAIDNFNGIPAQWGYNVTVEDEIAPEIKFSGAAVGTAKVGDLIAIPDFTVTDNLSATENITVMKYVLNPNGELITIPANSNSIRCSKAGLYEFRIMAVDEAGNVKIERLSVTVTEAA